MFNIINIFVAFALYLVFPQWNVSITDNPEVVVAVPAPYPVEKED